MATIHAFGPFRLDAEDQILFRGAEPLPVGRRAVALLCALVERPGVPVSKDALIKVAWSGLAIEESNLPVQIAALRKVLSGEPGGEHWIETLPRRGYRFVGPMITTGHNGAEPQTPAAQEGANLLPPIVSHELVGSDSGLKDTRVVDARNRAPTSLAPALDNLPHDLSSFVGRASEIAEIGQLLASTRLLTLCGVGGVGKTRLAIRVAARMRPQFADGVWLVDLAGLLDPALLPHAVASTLGVLEQRGRPLISTLASHLQSKELLLVLDNCEHLKEACRNLAGALLRSSASVRVMATSREVLGITGEVIFHVSPLSVPEAQHPADPATLLAFEAPLLFIERAACVKPGYQATISNASEIAQLCARLDGLPLAIELAAARLNVLSLSEICARLDKRLVLLASRSGVAPPRHQTLRATIDWSHDILSDGERIVFRRLSVFAGGWTFEAAEAICPGNELNSSDILSVITTLIEKSIVTAQTQQHETRYAMLATLREYANEKLIEAGEAEQLRERHLRYFSELTERVQPLLRGHDSGIWRDRLERDNDNLRAALQWSLEHGDRNDGLRLSGALEDYWRMLGQLTEGRHWLDSLLEAGPTDRSLPRARALFGAGRLAWGQGDLSRATELTQSALKIFRSVGDQWGVARSLMEIGLHSVARGEVKRAAVLANESLAVSCKIKDDYALGYALVLQAVLAEQANDKPKAEELFKECLVVRRRIGHKFGIVSALRSLGHMALRQERFDEAKNYYRESISIAWEAKELYVLPSGLEGLAAVAAQTGSPEYAARLFGAARRIRELLAVPPVVWEKSIVDDSCLALTAMLGPVDFASLGEQGRAMTIEQAIDEALK